MSADRHRASAGLVVFAALCLLSSWLVAAVWAAFAQSEPPFSVGTRLFAALVVYALTMGWQPLVATWIVRRWIDPIDVVDLGFRPAKSRDSVLAGVAAMLVVGVASLVALGFVALGWTGATSAHSPERGVVIDDNVVLFIASTGTVLIGVFQAMTEEVGWRGYFLHRATQRFGRFRGLVLQSVLWGVWYAPVIFFASYRHGGVRGAVVRGAVCVLTSALLGVLLGVLTLASRSLTPAVIANTTVTFAAGLPYVLVGIDAGVRSAVFGPAGWIVLGALVLALSSRCALFSPRDSSRTCARPALGHPPG